MTPQKDRYHLERVSTGGKSEFETFKSEKDHLHYFHFNDENGQALLYSQGYKDPRSRNAGIASVEKNAGRIERCFDGDCPYFIIRAGNKLEIARSREFADTAEMDAAIDRMQRDLLAGVAIGTTPAAVSHPASVAPKPETSRQPSRYRFSLEWQNRGQDEPLLGVIEYPMTGDKTTFKGIDTEAIGRFVAKFAQPVSAKKQTSPSFAVPPTTKELVLASAEGALIGENLLQSNTALEVRINLNAGEASALSEVTFMAKVYARSLDSGDKIVLAEQQGFVTDSGEIALPVQLNKLMPGTYRLVSDVDLHTDGRIKRLEASRLMHLVA
ncbi:MAG: DUF1508 domain-containing protein [Saprospiraceae bacterium]|nr:DUF1508 domain-containing protein [Saprospiraceae bacterium]